jgi:hypothetical protein
MPQQATPKVEMAALGQVYCAQLRHSLPTSEDAASDGRSLIRKQILRSVCTRLANPFVRLLCGHQTNASALRPPLAAVAQLVAVT